MEIIGVKIQNRKLWIKKLKNKQLYVWRKYIKKIEIKMELYFKVIQNFTEGGILIDRDIVF